MPEAAGTLLEEETPAVQTAYLSGGAEGHSLAVTLPPAEAYGPVFVAVTTPEGRLRWAGVYDGAARLTIQVPSLSEEDSVRLFWTDGDGCPAGEPADLAPAIAAGTQGEVYALLYSDGELVFQWGETPEAGREARSLGPVKLNGYQRFNDAAGQLDHTDTPWYEDREGIRLARFEAPMAPTSTAYWFCGCAALERVEGLERLDTSGVTDMTGMFWRCNALESLDLSGFDTANVTSIKGMFNQCAALKELDLSGFDTAAITDMSYLFYRCEALERVDLTGLDTARVRDMKGMFNRCGSLKTLDISSFETAQVTDMSYLFCYCGALTTIYASERFVTDSVTNGANAFAGCERLRGGSGTVYTARHTNHVYARIDAPPLKGYFTAK